MIMKLASAWKDNVFSYRTRPTPSTNSNQSQVKKSHTDLCLEQPSITQKMKPILSKSLNLIYLERLKIVISFSKISDSIILARAKLVQSRHFAHYVPTIQSCPRAQIHLVTSHKYTHKTYTMFVHHLLSLFSGHSWIAFISDGISYSVPFKSAGRYNFLQYGNNLHSIHLFGRNCRYQL